ncbi:HdeD family acid-resistance protein [Aminobacter sp. HY435]|uniref:HdeD family acid-resistance protein n=1 Tax=Aminobacter sp. HY435 TaxID=2970917 RepID=UPI0022B945E7|nr:HdeD family acid-resistance protein [Aminobacter sp. HY435]
MAISDQLPAGDVAALRSKWGWFVFLGIALLALGVIAAGNLLVATAASVFFVGAMMIVGGIVEIIHAFGVKSWGTFFWWLLSGILYLVAGYLAFANPMLAAGIMTLFLAIALIASGLLRIWVGFTGKGLQGWGWVVAGGVITVIAGLIISSGWPVNSLWILGLFLAIDLISQGVANIAFGFGLKRA